METENLDMAALQRRAKVSGFVEDHGDPADDEVVRVGTELYLDKFDGEVRLLSFNGVHATVGPLWQLQRLLLCHSWQYRSISALQLLN